MDCCGLDEGAAHVVRADQAHLKGSPLASAYPMAAGTPESGTGITTSASTGLSARIGPSRLRVAYTRGPPRAVGAREVHVLEDAEARRRGLEGAQRAHARAVDHQHLAGLDVAHELGGDEVEGRGLAGDHVGAVEDPEGERAKARAGRARR
jgi:hypothetical protein